MLQWKELLNLKVTDMAFWLNKEGSASIQNDGRASASVVQNDTRAAKTTLAYATVRPLSFTPVVYHKSKKI